MAESKPETKKYIVKSDIRMDGKLYTGRVEGEEKSGEEIELTAKDAYTINHALELTPKELTALEKEAAGDKAKEPSAPKSKK